MRPNTISQAWLKEREPYPLAPDAVPRDEEGRLERQHDKEDWKSFFSRQSKGGIHMPRIHHIGSTVSTIGLFCALGLLAGPAAPQSAPGPVIYLDQAWSQADRQWYYHFRKVRQSFRMTFF